MWRHEYKYLISESQLEILKFRIQSLMQKDVHTKSLASYRIRSLYFDDYINSCYYENENGIDPRKKFRIRIYNNSDDVIKLELKRKENGMCLKQSCSLTKTHFRDILGGKLIYEDNRTPLLNLFGFEIKSKNLHPVVIVDYVREPFVYSLGNVRVTFDTNISSSERIEDFFSCDLHLRPVLPYGMQLMEVKFDQFIPDYIYRALQLDDLLQTAFSKYYICRKFKLF